MTVAEYPALGFDPVPGVPSDVDAMHRSVDSAAQAMTRAQSLLSRLRDSNSGVWQGDAGDAFRSHVDTDLVTDLSHAQQSLTAAVGALDGWRNDLADHRQRAQELERQAAEARQAADQARAGYEQARGNPDLGLAGARFDDPAQLRQAQARLDTAERAVRSAADAVTQADGRLNSVLERARELEDEHNRVAIRAADALVDAAERLAPHKPGLLSRLGHSFTSAASAVGDWVKNHLDDIHSVLSTVSAVAGLVAVLTPPPIDAIALGVSVVAGAGALAVDLADPEFRHQVGRLMHGEFDSKSIGAVVTGATDILSVVPGVGAATKAVKGFEVAGSEFPRIVEIGSAVAHDPGIPAKLLSKLPQTGRLLEAGGLIEKGASASTMVTQNMVNILWKAKGAASNVYHDVKEAL